MIMAEKNAKDYQPVSDLQEENLFKLQCMIKATDIQHSTQCEFCGKLFLALASGNADVVLYFKRDAACAPIVKRVPWFQGTHKQISAFCFDPYGTWLLCASIDGSLYIVPALSLIDERYAADERWCTDDITSFPPTSPQSSSSKPNAIVWWQDASSGSIGIVGTECGEIIFINLETGQQVGTTHVNGNIVSLQICRNESNDSVSLLITSQTRQQWRLLLEQHTYNCLHSVENGESCTPLHTSDTAFEHTKNFASTRSRLQGLKQLSVEKLAILKQKFIETKCQNLGENLRSLDIGNNKNANATLNSDSNSGSNPMKPEPLSKDTFLELQYDRDDQQLYICYHTNTNHITVHGPDFSTIPLSVHKVFDTCKSILLAHRFFFITDINQHTVYVISDRLSEIRMTGDCKFNPECIVARFSFENSKEVIRAVYRATDFKSTTPRKLSEDVENKSALPKKVKDLQIELPHMDTCFIVTNRSVYKIVLRKSLLAVFMELVLRRNELEKAGKLAMVFGLNAQQLLEYAGDILLSNKEFPRAVASYKLSKCRLLKSVLKFASAGHTSELLSCLTHCLVSPAIGELPTTTRIHLSNLCVLAFIEMTLRASSQQSKTVYKEFLYFLSTNMFYDELLVVNIAGKTCLWEVLHHLATQRGLYGQMLEVLMKTIYSFGTSNFYPIPYGLLICLTEASLMQAMLINPELARNHIAFVLQNLQDSQIFVLQRLVTLYDPTSPVLRPRLVQCRARRRSTSQSSQSSQCDSIDLADNSDEADTLIEEIIETFLLILITLIYKRATLGQNAPTSYNIHLLGINVESVENITYNVDFKQRPLSSGFSHVALSRNGNVYTWGNAVQGCLGTGPSVLRYGSPHAITFFRTMEIEVFSVSCGHCHTLAVTNNGVYAWGASQFGQLGLGKVLQCSSPELVASLAQEVIIDVVAGQYHSVALTADGRVFTWGWGVHGQLGHGSTDERNTPTLVTSLLGIVVCQISAGHAHTLVLSMEGVVYAFGCNVFGQLGIGSNIKSSIPRKVLLPDKICLITTGYFHNLAVSHTNTLYIWGASPQVLRLQAQAQKKIRILEQQDNNKAGHCEDREKPTSVDTVSSEDVKENIVENDAQNRHAQAKATESRAETRKRQSDSTSLKNINVGLLEEARTHLKPTVVDTSLVRGEITQISTGCHHNALVTKDGSLYVWGRNLDGQIGNGSRREVPIPTPLCYNPASIFAQVPPRHNSSKRTSSDHDSNTDVKESNGNMTEESVSSNSSNEKEKINSVIKVATVSCGYDYTVAIQPGGAVLAWGNNNRAQLGRLPAKEGEDKYVILKSKRVVRFPHTSHVALDVPSQVPNIPAPVISYHSCDTSSLAGLIRPLSVIEKTSGEITLHYVLENFYGLYDSTKIMEKCAELKNYQACSKIAMLQRNISDAFSYQLKVLSELSVTSSTKTLSARMKALEAAAKFKQVDNMLEEEKSSITYQFKRNTELFNRQVEKNLIESVEDCAARNRMKIPSSKSLNSLHVIEQELYSFDCQGGSEELSKNPKNDDTSLDITEDTSDSELNTDDAEGWIENLILDSDSLSENKKSADNTEDISQFSAKEAMTLNINTNRLADRNQIYKNKLYDRKMMYAQKNNLTNETIKVIKFYINEIEDETNMVKCNILYNMIEFWIQHNLSIHSLENVFLEHINAIFYPLGLLLFCQEIMGKYLDANKNSTDNKSLCTVNLFSVKFCVQVCSMLLEHIDQDHPIPEYIKLLSSLTADHYGPPLTGYPGSSGNSTSKEMMEGILSTVSSDTRDSRSFVHIKEPDAAYRFLTSEEDTMVFTCGHHFPLSLYETEVIPGMETELLTSPSLVLPCTAQFLGQMLSQTSRPEILCPLCIPRALGAMVKKNNG